MKLLRIELQYSHVGLYAANLGDIRREAKRVALIQCGIDARQMSDDEVLLSIDELDPEVALLCEKHIDFILKSYKQYRANGSIPFCEDTTPGPQDDSDVLRKAVATHCYVDYKYGFKNIEQLVNWVKCPDTLRIMSQAGYALVCYTMPAGSAAKKKVFQGRTQVMFDADSATNREVISANIAYKMFMAQFYTKHKIEESVLV